LRDILTDFVCAVAKPGSAIYADHWSGYDGLRAAGFIHQPTNISASGDPAHVPLPHVHRSRLRIASRPSSTRAENSLP